MTIAGTYIFTCTRDDIIREAMLNIGKLGEAENPTAQEVTDCARKLNMLVKQWMGKMDFAPGLKMWTRRRGDLFLSNTQNQYNLGPSGDNWTSTSYSRQLTANASAGAGSITASIANVANGDFIGIVLNSGAIQWTTVSGTPSGSTINLAATLTGAASANSYVFNYTTKQQRPIQIETCVLRDVTGYDIPMNVMTLQDYEFLPSKQQPGYVSDPTAIYYESQLTNGSLYIDVYGAQDVTKRLHMVALFPVSDFNNPTDNPEYPQQWYRALCWGLTKEICPMFNVSWSNDMQLNYTEALTMAKEQDGETTSFYFVPGNDGLS